MYYLIGIKGTGMSALAGILKDLGYEEQTWYQKDENIKRYILLKKLGEVENE